MASRPLPPGRRRSSRPQPRGSGNLDLPQVKILEASDDSSTLLNNAVLTTSFSEEKEVQLPTSTDKIDSSISSTNDPSNDTIEKSYTSESSNDSNSTVSVEETIENRANQDQREHDEISQENPCDDALKGNKISNEVKAASSNSTQSSDNVLKEAHVALSNEDIGLIPEEPKHASPEKKPVSVERTVTSVIVPIQGEFHPLDILLPLTAIPEIPNDVTCLYDDAAVEMQKMILKAVKKFFRKDKVQVEEFKINARLYGNNFMDCSEYFDSLVKEFGPIRALQFAPCLVRIQPDGMKRTSLLLAAQSYALKNRDRVQKDLEKLMVTTDSSKILSDVTPQPDVSTTSQRNIVTETTLNFVGDTKDVVEHETSSVPVESSENLEVAPSMTSSTEEMQPAEIVLERVIDAVAVSDTVVTHDVLEITPEKIPTEVVKGFEDAEVDLIPEMASQNEGTAPVPDLSTSEQEIGEVVVVEKNVIVDPTLVDAGSSSSESIVVEKCPKTDIAAGLSTQSEINVTTTQESTAPPAPSTQMLFGFATAAADESDSDSSEFSD